MTNLFNLNSKLLAAIRSLLSDAKTQIQNTINHAMVHTYWHIGRLIVEHKQQGKSRASYGKQQIKLLSAQLKSEFGKGFDERNLRNMRAFYLAFSKWNTVCSKLSWSHYRVLLRIENIDARQWYMHECIEQCWSVRALERQVNVLYYERLLSSKNKQPVIEEAKIYTNELQANPKDYLRDPYVLCWIF